MSAAEVVHQVAYTEHQDGVPRPIITLHSDKRDSGRTFYTASTETFYTNYLFGEIWQKYTQLFTDRYLFERWREAILQEVPDAEEAIIYMLTKLQLRGKPDRLEYPLFSLHSQGIDQKGEYALTGYMVGASVRVDSDGELHIGVQTIDVGCHPHGCPAPAYFIIQRPVAEHSFAIANRTSLWPVQN